MAVVDYYYSLISPWSYLGHDALLATAAETGATIVHRPVRIFELFAANGAVPLPQRAPARQRYRLIELQRWREQRGLPLNLQPAFYPVDVADADRIVIALAGMEIDPSGFAGAAFRALWAEERNWPTARRSPRCWTPAGIRSKRCSPPRQPRWWRSVTSPTPGRRSRPTFPVFPVTCWPENRSGARTGSSSCTWHWPAGVRLTAPAERAAAAPGSGAAESSVH